MGVGGTGVADGGTGVGGTGVALGGISVWVGGIGVGGTGVGGSAVGMTPPAGINKACPRLNTFGSVRPLANMMASTATSYCWAMLPSVSPLCTM